MTTSQPQSANMLSNFALLCSQTEVEKNKLWQLPVIEQALSGRLKLETYVAFLSRAYHHVKHTVPLLMQAGARFSDEDDWLRRAMAEYIEEELGHEDWILNDIKACGGDAEMVRTSAPSFAVEVMVSYAYDSINRCDPLCFLGMVHVLEGTSVALASQVAQSLKTSLNLPNKAFSYLISHGDLDQGHQQFFEGLINRLSDDQLAVVVNASQRFYRLYRHIFEELTFA
ncbi:TenA family transcriptional regulator [Marinicella gelatinilytica]|uniref:TenA family transcriptional regulator n=1 Tax=Marinicella gelatinilytica TaxID=2996017 RepID=UPI002260ED49|nr:iron-containing redox enzyme family protein [Marinicella gelatinilytica]MCX7544697.1 iron-containing redox enzyme family protein [Marinicella gelatinilytica]